MISSLFRRLTLIAVLALEPSLTVTLILIGAIERKILALSTRPTGVQSAADR